MSKVEIDLNSFPRKPMEEIFVKLKAVFDKSIKLEYTRGEIGRYIGIENESTLGDWIRSMRAYGLIENAQPGSVFLTPLARKLARNWEDSYQSVTREAFFNVALFKHLHELFGEFVLENDLRKELKNCGIQRNDEVTHAIRVFKKAATFLGLWDESKKSEFPILEQGVVNSNSTNDLDQLFILYDAESAEWSPKKLDIWLRIVVTCFKRLPHNL